MNNPVTACHPASSAAESRAIITHQDDILCRRLVKSRLGLNAVSAAVTVTARVSAPSTPPRPHNKTLG